MKDNIIYGRKPVFLALDSPNNLNRIIISKSAKGPIIKEIIDKARSKKVVYSFLESKEIEKIISNSQGVLAYTSEKSYLNLNTLISKLDLSTNPIIAILDEVTDPNNLGAIIRSAYTLGIKAVILPKRNSCLVNNTVWKTSSGAVEFLDVVIVTNLVNTIKELKSKGFWIIGTKKTDKFCFDFKFDRPLALVFGSEGKGIRNLIEKNCDDFISIPHANDFDSLNVSNAAAIVFYEAIRQKIVEI